jgi:hypothetical protein
MEYWKADKDVHNKVMELIGQNHPDLALVAEEIVVVFREKASKSGGQVVYGKASKVPEKTKAIADEPYKFMLEIGADSWENELTSRQREALLDHLLCACRCEEDPKSGEFKLSIAPPDLAAFRENYERYGLWFPREHDEDEGPVDEVDNAVAEMFGVNEGE